MLPVNQKRCNCWSKGEEMVVVDAGRETKIQEEGDEDRVKEMISS